jgi:hypothetical protein
MCRQGFDSPTDYTLGVSLVAKASVLQAEYRGFESHTPNWSLPYGLDFKKVFNVEPEINVVYNRSW